MNHHDISIIGERRRSVTRLISDFIIGLTFRTGRRLRLEGLYTARSSSSYHWWSELVHSEQTEFTTWMFAAYRWCRMSASGFSWNILTTLLQIVGRTTSEWEDAEDPRYRDHIDEHDNWFNCERSSAESGKMRVVRMRRMMKTMVRMKTMMIMKSATTTPINVSWRMEWWKWDFGAGRLLWLL